MLFSRRRSSINASRAKTDVSHAKVGIQCVKFLYENHSLKLSNDKLLIKNRNTKIMNLE